MAEGNQAGFCADAAGVLEGGTVRAWFADPVAVLHYARAAAAVGLWASERKVFIGTFSRDQKLLDIGCGAGRIALGLWELGFTRLEGIDFVDGMIEAARDVAASRGAEIRFSVADATQPLPFAECSFDGAIFGFNGLMQIPGRENRRRALMNIRRVVRSGGRFVFTTHDREFDNSGMADADGADRDAQGYANLEPGDRLGALPEGRIFMHWPDRAEILEDLAATGWEHIEDHRRSHLANEPANVRAFSDECRFWICARALRE